MIYLSHRRDFVLINSDEENNIDHHCWLYRNEIFYERYYVYVVQYAKMFCDLYDYFEKNTKYVFLVKKYKIWFLTSENEVIRLKKNFDLYDWFLSDR